MSQNQQREQLGSRIGFLLLAAGCAIGLGNVWRFPYIAGAYGGALFVFIYIGFLLAVGVPILVMEFSVGRAAQRNLGAALQKLEPKGSRWHTFGPLRLIGSYLLMMFYTTVAGWMLAYCWSMLKGDLSGLTPEQVGGFFGGLISDPTSSCLWMGVAVIFCFTVCGMGLRRGVERVVKFMMVGLFALMIALVVRAVTLPGGEAGISFYLMPDPEKLTGGLWAAVTAAMGQAFFTLGRGVGSMTIFGSYIDKSRSLTGEAPLHRPARHRRRAHGGPHHLPGLFRLRGQPRLRPRPRIRNPAEHFQQYAFRTLLGLPVLRVHVLCGPVHGHRRL